MFRTLNLGLSSKHVGQWNCTVNVIELYILSDCEYKVKMYGMNNIKFIFITIFQFSKC
jgi:hypothetical protein